ncbi:PIN domain-containing protein [Rufibacter ruber]|uniref:PIN domain-containing protein n=1 Tax=Rufibacter ruber TaxID=1783499 RepID=UPI0019D3AB45|nr:PIN domain-containing protein [Rufibacter ruber]
MTDGVSSGHKHLHLHHKEKARDCTGKVQGVTSRKRRNSAITLAELEFGIRKSSNPDRNLEALNQFLVPLDIKDFNYNATVEYGKIRANLEKAGIPIGPLDTLIAAHAVSLNATLVTNNEKEFNRVTGLKIENWAN